MKIRYKDVLGRITGIATPMFGVSWNPPPVERDIVRQVMANLEDRRVLYYPYQEEVPNFVEKSIQEIRRGLSGALGQVEKDSIAGQAFMVMRGACREFIDAANKHEIHFYIFDNHNSYHSHEAAAKYFMALGKLRAIFGIQIARLSAAYGIDVENELAQILPPRPEYYKPLTKSMQSRKSKH